ncbi:MAG: histidine--tRNA ligase [Chloroflexi bacterium]|nr:histidine--tRNA ligase [Chloroflexota bacterium]
MALRAWLYGKMREVSERFGYQEWEAPFLETLDLYAAKSGEELVKEQAFVFRDRGGEQITLRPELTPSLARMVAQRQNRLPLPVRWWSFGPFWRYERPQKGRSREFFQWNIDLLGVDSPQADAEIAAIGAEFFRAVGLTPQQVCVQVNNRRLVDRKLQQFGFSTENRASAFRLIDRRDKLGVDSWRKYAGELGVSPAQLTSIEAMLADRELWRESPELVAFFEALQTLGAAEYVEYDPTVIRGLDYYTGTVFEARDRDGEFRAIFGGGHYDNLVSDVGGQPLAATGFAMGDMVIALALEKYGRTPALRSAPAQVLVTAFDAERMAAAIGLAGELRRAGFKVEWYPEPAKLQKQLKYADALGIPLAAIQGPDEVARGEVTLKNLPRREQMSVPRAEAAALLRRWLDSAGHS